MTYIPDVTSFKIGNADADEDEKHSRGLLLSVIIHDGQQLYHSYPHYLLNVHSQTKGVDNKVVPTWRRCPSFYVKLYQLRTR
jgi:hypothetical protein